MLNTLSNDNLKLSKCIFIDCKRKSKLKEYNKYYNKKLQGYYFQWNYSKMTDAVFSHSAMLSKLPDELTNYLHSNNINRSCLGRTNFENNKIVYCIIQNKLNDIKLQNQIKELLLSNMSNT